MRTGHTHIRQVRGSLRQHALVGRLHMRVRTNDRRHLPVEVPAHRDLFRRRLGVKVHEDDFGLLAQAFDLSPRGMKRVFKVGHERAALRVQNRNRKIGRASVLASRSFTPARRLAGSLAPPFECKLENGAALAGSAGGIIQRSQKAFFACEQIHYFLLVP
jgi:hypothetical protein